MNVVRGLILDIQADNLNSEDRAGGRALMPRRIGDAPHHRTCSKAFLPERAQPQAHRPGDDVVTTYFVPEGQPAPPGACEKAYEITVPDDHPAGLY